MAPQPEKQRMSKKPPISGGRGVVGAAPEETMELL